MFRNLRLYRLRSPWPDSEEALSHRLEDASFKPCGSLSEFSHGFEAPEPSLDSLCRRVAGADLMRLRSQSRILPAAAINEALELRIEEWTARTGELPSRRDKRDLKDEVRIDLLPRSLLKSDRTQCLCLPAEELLVVDAASEKRAEAVLDALRDALGSLQVTPLAFKEPIAAFMQSIFLGRSKGDFRIGNECRMEDPVNSRSTVTWLDMELSGGDVRRHVQDGLKLTRLAVDYDGVVSCVLGEDGVLRKFKLAGVDRLDDMPEEDSLARLDGEIALTAGSITRLVRALKKALGGAV